VGIAILGGTFDPVHNAHLAMAEAALKHLPVRTVLFMPTGNTHYRNPALASANDRVAMLKLALGGKPNFRIDERELASKASGYTVDTLKSLKQDHPEDLYFLMGSDQYQKLDSWRNPEEVRKLAQIVVFARPGNIVKDRKTIPFEPMKDSGTDIRARVKRGEDISGMVPAPVAGYIVRHGLYR
jgi:nicotinate-nucleotide adenylyltransferase